MADSFVSRFGCYTIIWDTTLRRQRRRLGATIPASWPEITRRRQLALEDGDTESESASDTFRRWRRPR